MQAAAKLAAVRTCSLTLCHLCELFYRVPDPHRNETAPSPFTVPLAGVSAVCVFPRGVVSLETAVLQHRQLHMNVPAASELSDVSQQLGAGLCDAASTGLLHASIVGPL